MSKIRTVEGIFKKHGKEKTVKFLHDYIYEKINDGMTIDTILNELSITPRRHPMSTYGSLYDAAVEGYNHHIQYQHI